MRTQQPASMYDLVYVVNGKVMEVVEENKTLSICRFKKSQIEDTTHRAGLLQERRVSSRPSQGWLYVEGDSSPNMQEILIVRDGVVSSNRQSNYQARAIVNGEVINTKLSTSEKWCYHDMGMGEPSRILDWNRSYHHSRRVYDRLFGEGRWKLVVEK